MGKIGSTRDAMVRYTKKGHCQIHKRENSKMDAPESAKVLLRFGGCLPRPTKILIKYLEQHVFAMSQKEVDITLIPQ